MTRLPSNASTLTEVFNHAIRCGVEGRWPEALATYERILRAAPQHALAWNNRGNVLQVFGRWDEAIASYDRAIAIRADYVDAVYNRATVLHRLARWDAALAGYEQALAMRPDHADALNNRAAVLGELGRPDEALRGFDAALASRPAYAQAHVNKARVLQDVGRFDEALENLETATRLDPTSVEAQWNRAMLLLLLGDFERGWPAYEWRWKDPSMRPFLREFTQPQWTGKESLAGKTVLLHAEQGIGDTLQFCRYVPQVANAAGHVILEALPALCALLAESFPMVEVVARGKPLPAFDLHCALGSLPLAFGTTLTSIPAPATIHASDNNVRAWSARLEEKTAPRIGIAWAGNPRHVNDARRSIALERLAPLLGEGFEFHALHNELRDAHGIRAQYPNLRLWTDALVDFAETAALVAHLDLVITVDTAVAHLAASMGKPVWILLPNVPDFRWLLGRTDSPWYPSVRLFRQPRRGDWESVVAEVAGAMAGIAPPK